MRRALLFVLLAGLLAPVSALAAGSAVPTDGTLAVRNGDGFVGMNLRGAMIGLVGLGRVEVEAPKDDDCDALSVWGAEREKTRLRPDLGGDLVTVCVFSGKDVRFRLIGQHQVRLIGKNISLSAVGRGPVGIKGDGGPLDGTYAVNGGEYVSLPDEIKRFTLGPLPPPPPLTNVP